MHLTDDKNVMSVNDWGMAMDNLSGLAGLEVFVRTSQMRSFAAAGRELGISASAVSKSISRLEERVGVRLFQRSTRSLHLTAEGEILLQRCQRIFAEVRAAEDDLGALTQHPRGRLKVGLSLSAGLPLPMLAAFMERYPDIELELDFTDRVVDVIDEGFDVMIRGSALPDSRLISRSLGQYRACVVAAPAYLARKGVPVKPGDLVHHACLHYRWATTGNLAQWPLHDVSTDTVMSLPLTMVSNSLDALVHMAVAGRGIACVPDFSVAGNVADGSLQCLLSSFISYANTFHVVWPSNRQMTPKVRAFIDFADQCFAQHLVGDHSVQPMSAGSLVAQ